jgi:hypothetical protein
VWEEVAGDWGRLHNEELHNLYASPNIIRVIKSRRMRWAGDVTRMAELRKFVQRFGQKSRKEEATWKS